MPVYLLVKRQQLDNLSRERHASRFQNTPMSEQQAVRTHGNHEKCPRFWVLRPAPFTLCNRLRPSRAKESDVPPSFQRHAALMRHELEEKGYEERARGQRFFWTKNLKSSPAVAERCVHLQNSSVRGTSCSCDDLPQKIFSVKLRTSSKSFSSCTIQDGVVNELRVVEARHDTVLTKLSQEVSKALLRWNIPTFVALGGLLNDR